MDQSKWALPRQRLLQTSKEGQGLIRPRLKLHAVWLHGVVLNLFLIHPGVPSDSSLILECFLQPMEDATGIFHKHSKEMPDELICWVSGLHFVLMQ